MEKLEERLWYNREKIFVESKKTKRSPGSIWYRNTLSKKYLVYIFGYNEPKFIEATPV